MHEARLDEAELRARLCVCQDAMNEFQLSGRPV